MQSAWLHQVRRTLAGGWLFGVHFEPHTQGSGGGRGGAAKRKRGEGMDTDAVQSTLQAMRIQVTLGLSVLAYTFTHACFLVLK